MIKPAHFEAFAPFGRTYYHGHPFGDSDLQGGDVKSAEQRTEPQPVPIFREERLYSQGRTVVWSKGSSQYSKVAVKSFTVDSDVVDCLWCDFTLPSAEPDSQESSRSLCVLEIDFLNVFVADGAMHTASLPFLVNNVWSIPGGLLLERTVTATELTNQKREVPTLFSLLHPLDEPRPVTSQAQGKVNYICDPTVNVLFTSQNPALVMMYDSVMGLHSIWLLSKAAPEDMPESPSTSHNPPDVLSGVIAHHPTPIMTAAAHSRLSIGTPTHSPFRSYTPSPTSRSHMQSPAPLRLLSPALGHHTSSQRRSPFLESPLMTGFRSPSVFRSPPGSCSREGSFLEGFEPLAPEVCLKRLWQETPSAVRHGAKGKASKILLTTDVCGNTYFCFLVRHTHRLRMLKMLSKEDGSRFVFIPAEEIPARDVVELKQLDMMLVLEMDYSLTLYSGPVKASTVHLPSLPVDLPVFPSSPQGASDEVVLLSPLHERHVEGAVQEDSGRGSQTVEALRDPHPLGCNLVLSGGSTFRLLLPPLCKSTAVCRSVHALKCLLPAHIATQFILTYYRMAHHNADRLLWEIQNEPQGDMDCFTSCIQSMLGYSETKLEESGSEEEMQSDSPAAKKSKTEQGLEGDAAWSWLMNSEYNDLVQRSCEIQFPVKCTSTDSPAPQPTQTKLDENALLFNHTSTVLFALHLVYEDLKLDILAKNELYTLGEFLCRLARDLGWLPYTEHYCRDHPTLAPVGFAEQSAAIKDQLTLLKTPDFVCKEPPSIHLWLIACLRGEMRKPFPLLYGVCKQTYLVTTLYSLFVPLKDGGYINDPSKLYSKLPGKGLDRVTNEQLKVKLMRCRTTVERVVVFMAENGLTTKDVDRFPFGVGLPLREAVHMCRRDPPFNLPQTAYLLIGREDLATQVSTKPKEFFPQHGPLNKPVLKEGEKDDGMAFNEEVMRLRFGKDLRIKEIRRLLQSAKPVRVSLMQKPEVSDHDFIQEQETRLLMMCKRTMALAVGRGMFTLATSRPVLTETLPIPPLELTGRAPPRNTVVGLDHVDSPADMKLWPQFHNGVAAGLRIAPGISQIDSTWIVYNKPKELTNEHAGFLMALGLNGHLNCLAKLNLHDYLVKGHELTTVGLLLGISAERRGSMDLPTTKVLSIHVDALLPPTSAELDVPHSAQVAGVLGIGLVYQATAHRRMAEVLLSEIGRPAGPEMENAVNRESYSLSAGIALGLVMLQHGNEASGVADLKMADQLYQYMVGGHKKPQTGTQKEKFKSPSYLIKEGDTVNIDVTAAGATLALGLMFMKTNNRSVASWLNAPDTQFLLDSVRPDFLLLRLLSRGLIMWESILPSTQWIDSHIPPIVQKYAFCSDVDAEKVSDTDIDLQTLSQAKANIIAGCCLAMGMRFAGSANQEAFTCLLHYTRFFKGLLSSAIVEQAGKPTLETCMNIALLSLTLVMAGTGNLDVLRVVRQLHKRHSTDVPYGSHMAVHMALGLLFLGGGRYTLSSSGPAIAALVCALYPKFPISSTDNRYHLQAFRHLYVLAAEPRVIVTREVESHDACYVPLEITLKSTEYYPETTLSMTAPCIVPELHLIKKISIVGPRYLPINIELDSNTSIAKCLLSKFGTVFVKRRAGYLSYADDPKGYRNLLARTFPEQTDKTDVIRSFSSEPQMVALAGLFCDILSVSSTEKEKSTYIGAVLHECITEEKPDAINVYLAIKKEVENIEEQPDLMALWELKLVLCFYDTAFHKICGRTEVKPLLSLDFITQCKVRLDNALDQSIAKASFPLATSLEPDNYQKMFSASLAGFTVHHDIPPPHKRTTTILQASSSPVETMISDSSLPVSALVRLQSSS